MVLILQLWRSLVIDRFILVGALAVLAACSPKSDTGGKRQAKGEAPGTTFSASADSATGNVKIALPGAKLDIDVPGEVLAGGTVDLDGLKLYPGSKVDTMNVVAHERDGEDAAKVDIGFTTPADPATVRAWMLSQSAHLRHPLRAAGDGLAGATREGKAITVALSPADGGRTKGAIRIAG